MVYIIVPILSPAQPDILITCQLPADAAAQWPSDTLTCGLFLPVTPVPRASLSDIALSTQHSYTPISTLHRDSFDEVKLLVCPDQAPVVSVKSFPNVSRPSLVADPGYMSRKIRKFRTDKFDT